LKLAYLIELVNVCGVDLAPLLLQSDHEQVVIYLLLNSFLVFDSVPSLDDAFRVKRRTDGVIARVVQAEVEEKHAGVAEFRVEGLG
jgi:hypothetical protein